MCKIPAALLLLFAAPLVMSATRPDNSWLIGPVKGPRGFGEIRVQGDATYWRLLSPTHQLLSQVRQPAIPRNHTFSFGECSRDGVEQTDLAVEISVPDPKGKRATAVRAWRFSPAAKSIRPAQVNRIVCYNPDYGF